MEHAVGSSRTLFCPPPRGCGRVNGYPGRYRSAAFSAEPNLEKGHHLMLRNKLSFILASSLCLAFAGCDDDDGGDTGAGATESGTTTDDPTTTTDTPATTDPTTDGETTDNPTTDGETTDDPTTDDSSTTDDTSADPCDDVVCEDGESCLGGICVEDVGETEGETEGETGDPGMSDYGSCDMCAAGESPTQITGLEGCFCSPMCDGGMSECPTPNSGTAVAGCALGADPMAEPNQCALICLAGQEGMCPDGASCQDTGQPADPMMPDGPTIGLCTFPVPMG